MQSTTDNTPLHITVPNSPPTFANPRWVTPTALVAAIGAFAIVWRHSHSLPQEQHTPMLFIGMLIALMNFVVIRALVDQIGSTSKLYRYMRLKAEADAYNTSPTSAETKANIEARVAALYAGTKRADK